MSRRILVAATAASALVVVACGVPSSGDFEAIPPNEFPPAIRDTRPSTTTTTVATTVATTLPGPTTTEPRVTTTTSTVPTEAIQLFYVQGSKVRSVTVTEKSPVSPGRKLLDLVERVGIANNGIRLASIVPVGADMAASLTRGVTTIELGTSIDRVLPEDQPLFFAQVVLSVLAPSRQGQVVFTQRGLPYPAVKSDGTVLEPGVPAAWEDYADLIVSDLIPVATTTATTRTVVPTTRA